MLDASNQGESADRLKGLMAEIVSAYVSRNSVPAAELPKLITIVHKAIGSVAAGSVAAGALKMLVEAPKEPAVPVKKSIHDGYIVCLEDGKKFKTLRRHLANAYGLTPESYRTKWGLPSDYPMVAPAYSATRSRLAKAAGLGSGGTAAQQVSIGPGGTTKRATSRRSGKTA